MGMPTLIETGRGLSLIDTPDVTVNNSTSEITVFSTVIPAKRMSTNKAMNFKLICNITTALSLVPNLTIRIKFGSSTLNVMNASVLSVGLSNVPITITGMVVNKDSSSAQFIYGETQQNNVAARNASADWTVDTSTNQTFSVTAQFGGLSLGTSITSKFAQIELT